MTVRAPLTRRRRLSLALLACLVLGSAAGLTVGLVSCVPPADVPGRPLTEPEARRLSAMGTTNYHDAQVGVRAAFGPPEGQTYLTGWVDWPAELIYVAISGTDTAGGEGDPTASDVYRSGHRLLQAVPGLIATRSDRRVPVSPAHRPPQPPPAPPTDGWRIRPSRSGTAPLDSLLALILAVGQKHAERTGPAESEARLLRRDRAGGAAVDVVLGPQAELPDPYVTAGTTDAGTARYWIDGTARLRRFETVLPGGLPARVDFERTAPRPLTAIDAFGGPPTTPRPVTAAEATLLSRIRQRDREQYGANIRVRLPGVSTPDFEASGWLDWRNSLVYLAARDGYRSVERILIRADRGGLAVCTAPSDGDSQLMPPLPPPPSWVWAYTAWERRGDSLGGRDFDLLISEALSAASDGRDDEKALRASALWLRTDTVDGTPVAVFEIPKAAATQPPDDRIGLRYWVDSTGVLRRLELRTQSGVYARLDLDPGPVPYVGDPPLG